MIINSNEYTIDYSITNVYTNGSVSKPCTPVVHIKIAGIYGCSSH